MSGLGTPLPTIQAQGCIYLDYNATTPIWPEVAESMSPFLTEFGNPSSTHPYGCTCKAAVENARKQVAELVNANPEEIVFMSCGTEADNSAIWGAVAAFRRNNLHNNALPHVLTTVIEHPAVLEQLNLYKQLGILDFIAVRVNSEGLVSVSDIEAAITETTCLITVMHSNNEVGSIQPIAEIAALGKARNIPVHSDAAQSIGKVPIDVKALDVDMLTIVGHKFGAPKGVAALYIRPGTNVERFLCGGGQESGRRAGTENVILIVGLGKAAAKAKKELSDTMVHMKTLRDALQEKLMSGAPEGSVKVNGPSNQDSRLPNTLSISFKGIQSSKFLGELSEQLAASAGAACHSSAEHSISSVLWAMGVAQEWAVETLRLSMGRHSTMEDVEKGAELILKRLRGS